MDLGAHEAARLGARRRHDILDTGGEPAVDDLTRLAAEICGVPIAPMSLSVKDVRRLINPRTDT